MKEKGKCRKNTCRLNICVYLCFFASFRSLSKSVKLSESKKTNQTALFLVKEFRVTGKIDRLLAIGQCNPCPIGNNIFTYMIYITYISVMYKEFGSMKVGTFEPSLDFHSIQHRKYFN